jgi:RHS repeat-associated protein
VVQETHYDPWGVELQGLGYQEPGIKVNKYLYNGKEFNDHLGINLFDYGARMYDASIGRWFVVDPMAEAAPDWTPYRYGFNNPVKFIDPNGMFEWTDGYGTYDSRNSTVSRSSFSGMYSEGKGAVFLGMNYSVNAQGERTSSIHRYVEYADGSTKNITSTGNFGSPALFGAGGFGDMDGGNNDYSFNWNRAGNALTAGGVAYYGLEKSINNSKYWVDAKGNIRTTGLLKQRDNGKYVRGVQGLRNSQGAAANAASKYAVAGKVVGGLGMGVTYIQYRTGQISGTEASIDLIMGGIGFTGWGAPVSLMYFGGKFLYEYSTGNTLFEKPVGR